jgi:CBS domain-containing protein
VTVPTLTAHNVTTITQVRRQEMKQVITSIPVQKPPVHPPPATATVAGILRPPLTTVGQHDHVAAATYLMKHTGTTALIVADAQTDQPAGIITETDIVHAIADGKNANDIWVDAVMTTRPAITTTTSISDAAKIMTATHLRHLPVTGDAGILGIVDITDVCQALINTGQGDPSPVADPDRAARPSPSLSPLSGARPAVT